jgi:hypothetical protein
MWAIASSVEGEIQRCRRDNLEKIWCGRTGRPVQSGRPDALERPGMLVVEVLGTLEHQVLE